MEAALPKCLQLLGMIWGSLESEGKEGDLASWDQLLPEQVDMGRIR